MPTLIQQPSTSCPAAVENCILFSLWASEYRLTLGTIPYMMVCLPQTGSQQTNGDTFTMLGKTFTVDNTSDWTKDTYNGTDSSAAINGRNLLGMIRANFIFHDFNTNGYLDGSNNFCIEIEGKTRKVEPNWAFDFSTLTNPFTPVVVAGVASTFISGYQIIYRLYKLDAFTGDEIAVCPLQAATPAVNSTTDQVITIPLDFQHMLSGHVKTTIAPIGGGWFYDNTALVEILLKYGSIQDSGNCGVDYNQMETSSTVKVVNYARQPADQSGFNKHCYLQEAAGVAKFMTSAPTTECVGEEGHRWLWFYANYKKFIGGFSTVDYEVRFEFFLGGVSQSVEEYAVGTTDTDGVIVTPVGPANMQVTQPANYDSYTVTFQGLTDGIFGPQTQVLSEVKTYKVQDCKHDEIEFLTHAGGYAVLNCMKKQSVEINSEMSEICRDIDCGGTYQTQLYQNGRSHIGGKAYEQLTFESTINPNKEDDIAFLADFKASMVKLLIMKDNAGQVVKRKLLLEPGTTKIWSYEEKLKVTFRGIFAQDYNRISEE